MRLFRNNAVVLVLFIVLAFVNAYAIMEGWYQ